MTAADLQEYVQASDSDAAYVARCWDEASTLVNGFVGSSVVPVDALLRATLEVGSELFHRRNAPNGVAQFATLDGAPVRVARDPMVGAYPILRHYVRGFG